MLLSETTWTKVDEYLKLKQCLILPIGSVEQHGPTALVGTDFMTAQYIAKKVGEKTGLLVAPPLCYGMANHHLGFPGSSSLNPSTYIQVILDLLRSWMFQGFKSFVFINGHGGNTAPLSCALSELKRDPIELKTSSFDWWHLPSVKKYEEEHFGNENGHHATCGEVSVTMEVCPEAFQKIDAKNFKVQTTSHHWPLSSLEMKHYHPDGRMDSNPGLATKEHGQKISALAVQEICEKLEQFGYV